MSYIRVALLGFIVAFALVPLPVEAQTIAQRVAALEQEVARLDDARARHNRRLRKLEGNIVEADLAGSYRVAGIMTDLDGNEDPASVTVITLSGIMTLNADLTGSIQGAVIGIDLVEGTPWSSGVRTFPDEQGEAPITWSYANGILSITDGTPNLALDFNVGAGGRVITFSGLSDDDTADLIIGTRLQ
jgi:hypothetical protein